MSLWLRRRDLGTHLYTVIVIKFLVIFIVYIFLIFFLPFINVVIVTINLWLRF